MKQVTKTGRRNGIIIGALVVLALLIYSELSGITSVFSRKDLKVVSFESVSAASEPKQGSLKPPEPKSSLPHQKDGGPFVTINTLHVLLKFNDDFKDCQSFSRGSSHDPIKALIDGAEQSNCIAIEQGLLITAEGHKEEVSSKR
jgi:hypothetical protein